MTAPIIPTPRFSLLAALVLAACLTAAFYDVVFLNKTFKATTANAQALPTGVYGQANNKPRFIPVNGTDTPVSEEPIYELIKNSFRQGVIPLWNPYQACGVALIGMIEVGMFYPLNIILYLLPNIIAWDILILARLFFAGLFTFWFMRRLGFDEIPSLAAGIIFMLSGPMVLLQYWTANVDLLLPLLLLCIDRLIQTPTRRSVCATAVVTAMTFYAGHPEHIFLVNTFGFVFYVFRLLTLRPKSEHLALTLKLLSAYALGMGLAATVLFPFLRNFHSEFWHGHPDGTGLLMEEQRDRAISLLLPHFFQRENLKYDFTFAGWWGGYLGTLPVALAFLSLWSKHNRGLNYFFAAMTLIIVGKQYGLFFINWLGYLPLFDVCRFAIHTPPLAALCVAVLAGIGLHAILNNAHTFRRALLFCAGLALIVLVHLIVIKNTPYLPFALKASAFATGLLAALLLVLRLKDKKILTPQWLSLTITVIVFFELFSYIHRERPRRFDSFPLVPYIESLKSAPEPSRAYGIFWAFYPNTATGFGVDDLGYFLGLVPKRYVEFVNALLVEDHFKNDLRPPALRAMPIDSQRRHILDLLNVRYIVGPAMDGSTFHKLLERFEQVSKRLALIYNREVTVYERASALPRAFVVHRVVFEPSETQALALLKQLGPSVSEGVVLNHQPVAEILSRVNSLPLKSNSQATFTRNSVNEITIQAKMEQEGFVVLSEAYHPDWKAYLNGTPVKIFQANHLLRAVLVPPGEHKIRMVFAPVSFYWGVIVSLLCVLICIFMFIKKKPLNPSVQDRSKG